MALGVLRTKSLDAILADAEEPEMTLNRTLGASDIVLLGIGAIIGAGIFSTVGTAAAGDADRPGAGAALMLSFIITAVVCSFTALCYAEFASMVPISGSAYTYSYATLGEVVAWIIGWDLIIEYAVGNVSVAISWAGYFRSLLEGLGIKIPLWMAMEYRGYSKAVEQGVTTWEAAPHLFGEPIVINLLAASIVFVLTVLLVWGVKESVKFNSIMVLLKIGVLIFFVIVGFLYVRPENYTPFAPTGFAGISTAAAIVFFAYIGFDAVSTVAEETQNPQRNLPIGIIGSLIICTIFYVVVAAVFTGLISYNDLQNSSIANQAEPLTYALRFAAAKTGAGAGWIDAAAGIVAVGAVIATTAVLLVFQLGQPRIFFSMARDGLLPQAFAKIHPKFRTPHVTTILTGVVVGVISAFTAIDEMVDLTNIGTLFAFILVCGGVIILRATDPGRARPFRVPGGYIIPILGIISCIYLMYFLPSTSWFRFAAWLNLGFVVYIAYGATHSRLTGRAQSADANQHDAETAWAGASLGAVGLAILLGALAVDIAVQRNNAVERANKLVTAAEKLVGESNAALTKAKEKGDAAAVEIETAHIAAAQARVDAGKVQLDFAKAQKAGQDNAMADAEKRAKAAEHKQFVESLNATRVEAEKAAATATDDEGRAVAQALAEIVKTQEAFTAARDAEDSAKMDASMAQLFIDEAQLAEARARQDVKAGAPDAEQKLKQAQLQVAFAKAKTEDAATQKSGDEARKKAAGAQMEKAQQELAASGATPVATRIDDIPSIDLERTETVWTPSWFLVIPLLLNILMLFPTIILRARSALSSGVTGNARTRSLAALAIAAILMVASLAYLVMVAPSKFM